MILKGISYVTAAESIGVTQGNSGSDYKAA